MNQPILSIEALEPRQLLTAGPSATFMQYVKGAGTSRTFAVLYDSEQPIDRASLNDYQVYIIGPGDFDAPATFVGAARHDPGTGWVVLYRIDGIMGGSYTIKSPYRGPVAQVGTPNPGELGGFIVGKKGHTIPRGGENVPAVQVVGTTFGTSEFPPEIDTSFGTVVRAVNFGGDAETLTGSTGIDVDFDSQHATSVGAKRKHPRGSRASIQTVISANGEPLYEQITGDNPVFETEIYNASATPKTLTITGLDPARRYRIQYLHGDGNQGETPYTEASQVFTLPTGESATTSLQFNLVETDADCIMTIDVSGTTEVQYEMPGTQTRAASFSGVVIEASEDIAPSGTDFIRSSVKLSGASQTFDLAFSGLAAAVAKISSTPVVVTGPNGFSAVASLLGINTSGPSFVGTYRLDGIDVTGSYTISYNGQQVGRATFFYLRPVIWV